MRGWRSYFGFCETPEVLITSPVGSDCDLGRLCGGSGNTAPSPGSPVGTRGACAAGNTAGSGLGPWYLGKSKALSVWLTNAYLKPLGLPSLFEEVSA